MLFWTTHFSVLDSTFFVLDSTFWLDSTLKIDPVLVCPSVCPSVRKVTHERMVGRRSNFVDQIWSACARDDHLQVIEFGMIWFSTWIQDHFSTFLNITIYGCYCVHKTKYTLVNCFRGKRRSVSALCPPPSRTQFTIGCCPVGIVTAVHAVSFIIWGHTTGPTKVVPFSGLTVTLWHQVRLV